MKAKPPKPERTPIPFDDALRLILSNTAEAAQGKAQEESRGKHGE